MFDLMHMCLLFFFCGFISWFFLPSLMKSDWSHVTQFLTNKCPSKRLTRHVPHALVLESRSPTSHVILPRPAHLQGSFFHSVRDWHGNLRREWIKRLRRGRRWIPALIESALRFFSSTSTSTSFTISHNVATTYSSLVSPQVDSHPIATFDLECVDQ